MCLPAQGRHSQLTLKRYSAVQLLLFAGNMVAEELTHNIFINSVKPGKERRRHERKGGDWKRKDEAGKDRRSALESISDSLGDSLFHNFSVFGILLRKSVLESFGVFWCIWKS